MLSHSFLVMQFWRCGASNLKHKWSRRGVIAWLARSTNARASESTDMDMKEFSYWCIRRNVRIGERRRCVLMVVESSGWTSGAISG